MAFQPPLPSPVDDANNIEVGYRQRNTFDETARRLFITERYLYPAASDDETTAVFPGGFLFWYL